MNYVVRESNIEISMLCIAILAIIFAKKFEYVSKQDLVLLFSFLSRT